MIFDKLWNLHMKAFLVESDCYGLNLFSKDPCVRERLLPTSSATGKCWNLWEVGSAWGKLGHCRHALEGILAPSHFLFFLDTMRYTGLLQHTLPSCHRPKSNGANRLWPETMSHNKSFLLISWFSQAFVRVMKSWLLQWLWLIS
jgi:hypothetical protein